jgi:glycosyltransferase involved in cell wall biosynthesis
MEEPTTIISIVIPAYNEGEVIERTIEEVDATLRTCDVGWEIIVVDDGSTDGTIDRLRNVVGRNPKVRALRLSRNFGKEAAILAGLEASLGEAVVTLDADLQHPPALIPEMIQQWSEGAMVVNGVKRDYGPDGRVSKTGRAIFNASLTYLGGLKLKDASDFKLLDRVVVEAIVHGMPERTRFYRGLTDWVGYPQATVHFDVAERAGGKTKWSVYSLVKLAISAIVSFTVMPLRIVTYLGIATLIFGAVVGADALISWNRGQAVSGFATIIITLCVIGSFIMLSLGIIGEYIGRIFQESKFRPPYLVDAALGFDDTDNRASKIDHSAAHRSRGY